MEASVRFLWALLLCTAQAGDFNASSCTVNGKRMYGRVQLVTSFPDVKAQVVENFPDLKVLKKPNFAQKCGEWQIVTTNPDVKVQLVPSFGDIKIQWVEHFPGPN